MEGVMDAPLLAHVAHQLVYVLYGVPVLVVLGSIVVTSLRDRRARNVNRSPAP